MVIKMPQSDNPLRRYFRQPAIHIRLPSNGKYYPPGTLTVPANGELPVLPMTAVDEITSRTPDALFNGSAVMEIIGSCVPSIADPWHVPSVDINTLMVAIRLASYGHEMEISSKCPKCGHDHNLTLDLRVVLDGLKAPNYNEPVIVGDLTFNFSPMNYRQLNENSKINFEDQKLIQMLGDSELTEEDKMQRLGNAFRKMTSLTIKSIADSISSIKAVDSLVTDRVNIEDFLYNCPKSVFDQIRDHAIKLREASDIRPVAVTCENCANQYEQSFTLDMSNFFGNAS